MRHATDKRAPSYWFPRPPWSSGGPTRAHPRSWLPEMALIMIVLSHMHFVFEYDSPIMARIQPTTHPTLARQGIRSKSRADRVVLDELGFHASAADTQCCARIVTAENIPGLRIRSRISRDQWYATKYIAEDLEFIWPPRPSY